MKNKVTIIGGGPAGLFSAFLLLNKGYQVDLYDQMSGVGKKFLIAGNGGLNLTHSENLDTFCSRYGKDSVFFKELIEEFTPNDLRAFCSELGVDTFIGTSGRIFPEKLKAAQILINWVKKLKSFESFQLHLKHKLVNLSLDRTLSFEYDDNIIEVKPDMIIFALGGASWEKTGSDGKWNTLFEKSGINLSPFLPMNCGFEREWSDHFISKVDRTPLKNVSVKINENTVRGELMLTPFGVEGGAIYAISNHIRNEILKNEKAIVTVDLKPDLDLNSLISKLNNKKDKVSLSNHLRKSLKLDKAVIVLLRELYKPEELNNTTILAEKIKNLELELVGIRPLSEAISTSGGVCFEGLTKGLESKIIPRMFVVGEMLDFEAPTGGYLLQGCFSTAKRAVSTIEKLKK